MRQRTEPSAPQLENNTKPSAPISGMDGDLESVELGANLETDLENLKQPRKYRKRCGRCCHNFLNQAVFSILGGELEEEGAVRVKSNKKYVVGLLLLIIATGGLFLYTYNGDQNSQSSTLVFSLLEKASVCMGNIKVNMKGRNITFVNKTDDRCSVVATCTKDYYLSTIVFPLVFPSLPQNEVVTILSGQGNPNPAQACHYVNPNDLSNCTLWTIGNKDVRLYATIPRDIISMGDNEGICVKTEYPKFSESLSKSVSLCIFFLAFLLPCINCGLGRKAL